MERRDFLRVSALAGAGAASVGSAGCAGLGGGLAPPLAPMSGADMDGFLARLDRSMASIATGQPFADLIPKRAELAADPAYEKGQDVLRKAVRSLLLVGSFNDLPEEGRAHPGMQDRMWRSMAEMDEAMMGITGALDALTPTERADIGQALREDPDLGMRLVEAIDREGAAQGVPQKRRLHMRAIAVQVCGRLRQSAPLLIDEYVGKVRRVAARHGTNEEVERRVAAQMGDTAFWAMRERTLAHAAQWNVADGYGGDVVIVVPQGAYPPGVVPPGPYYAPPQPSNAVKHRRANVVITVGAVLLGVGVIVGVAGGVAIASGAGLGAAAAITVGAVVGIGGLITLIVGLVLRYR